MSSGREPRCERTRLNEVIWPNQWPSPSSCSYRGHRHLQVLHSFNNLQYFRLQNIRTTSNNN
ncbi:hypothetical protein BLOT_000408 [Blomia tropicalis]|nr:hypothetical protein BLOT_000408 [Blomia tropicalis]